MEEEISERNQRVLADYLTGCFSLRELGEKYRCTKENIRLILEKSGGEAYHRARDERS